MTEKTENQRVAEYALEDLQRFVASAPSDTTERELLAWQKGYIAGVNRALDINT